MSTLPFGPQPFRIANYSVFEGWTSTSIRFLVCPIFCFLGFLYRFFNTSRAVCSFSIVPEGGGARINPRGPRYYCIQDVSGRPSTAVSYCNLQCFLLYHVATTTLHSHQVEQQRILNSRTAIKCKEARKQRGRHCCPCPNGYTNPAAH